MCWSLTIKINCYEKTYKINLTSYCIMKKLIDKIPVAEQ